MFSGQFKDTQVETEMMAASEVIPLCTALIDLRYSDDARKYNFEACRKHRTEEEKLSRVNKTCLKQEEVWIIKQVTYAWELGILQRSRKRSRGKGQYIQYLRLNTPTYQDTTKIHNTESKLALAQLHNIRFFAGYGA